MRKNFSGVSLKIEVASRFEQSNRQYQQGAVAPLFLGEEGPWAHSSPENFEISKSLNTIFSILGNKFEDKRAYFSSKKMKLSIYQSHNQFLQAINN